MGGLSKKKMQDAKQRVGVGVRAGKVRFSYSYSYSHSFWKPLPLSQILACLSIALACGLLPASITIVERPAAPPLEPMEAQRYAQQLSRIIEYVHDKYVRPISRADLAAAALRGMYGAAQLPVPPALRTEVVKAARDAYELHRLLVRTRESLGNPEPLRGSQAILASLRGMTEALDPFCVLLTGAELDHVYSMDSNQRGCGLEVVMNAAAPVVIKAVVPGSPAQKAGLRPGDQITHLDGQAVNGPLTSPEHFIQERAVQIQVYRPSTHISWKATLKPENFRQETVLGVMREPDNSWDYFLDHQRRIAHVRIGALKSGTAAELGRVLSELTEAGMRGLILDLRWSPGGILDEARQAADLFIAGYVQPHLLLPMPGNLLAMANLFLGDYPQSVTVVYRSGGLDEHHTPLEPGFVQFPIVVLINAETSGGAELIASVLQDNRRAQIAGQRSLGKGSVQKIEKFDDIPEIRGSLPRAGFKLSEGMLIRPNRRNLHRFADSKGTDDWGVRPDPKLEFRVSADLGRQLREWWQLQDLRPGSSDETLPLDDPIADPQRQAALQVLMEMLK
jgi:carboxyl-terminal processing protease